MTLIPTIYNADTAGIRPDSDRASHHQLVRIGTPEFKGKASILELFLLLGSMGQACR